MIFLAIFINFLLILFNIYLVIKIWHLRKTMTKITSDLINYESSVKSLLTNTTQILNQQQTNMDRVRRQYQILQLRWQKIRQAIVLLNWIYRIGVKKNIST